MSFTCKVKNELSALEFKDFEKIRSQLCSMLIFGGKFYKESLTIFYENENVTKRLCYLLDSISEQLPEKIKYTIKSGIFFNKKNYKIKVNFFNNFFLDFKNFSEFYKKNIKNNSKAEFLSGIFLSCGNIANPEVDYHLEFNVSSEKLARFLVSIFNSFKTLNINPGIISRKKRYLVYIKGSEKITDFLVLTGAKLCAMEFMQVKMVKEVRNHINRTTNFETANISKAALTASEHIKSIKKIKRFGKFNSLPKNLKEIAELRLNNPYASLNELSKLCKNPITKSGVNHRLHKLMRISKNL